MIAFKRRSLWASMLRLIPAVRRRQDARLEAAIARLMADPSLPCVVGDWFIPDGFRRPGRDYQKPARFQNREFGLEMIGSKGLILLWCSSVSCYRGSSWKTQHINPLAFKTAP